MSSSSPRTLVVGGTGPIGTAISRVSAQSAMTVITSSRNGAVRLDVAEPEQVREVVREVRPEALIYLVRAPRTADEAAVRDSAAYLDRVVTIAADHGLRRAVLASSAAVYGDRHPEPRRETDPLEGTSVYAAEKKLAEDTLATTAEQRGISAASLRIFNVFGPGCGESLLNALVDGPPPLLRVTTQFVRDYVHVDDVAAALLRAVACDEVRGIVNVGSGRGIDNTELAAARPGAFRAGDGEIRSFSVADPRRVREELDWWPEVDPLAFVRGMRS